jgi:hypothetical protein
MRIGLWLARNSVLLERIEKVFEAIVPVRKRIQNITSEKLGGSVTEITFVVADPNHEIGIAQPTLHYLPER